MKGEETRIDRFIDADLFSVAQGKENFRTKTINNTTDPEWNEVGDREFRFKFDVSHLGQVFEFVVEQYERDSIEFEVYDEDPGKDDFIGR